LHPPPMRSTCSRRAPATGFGGGIGTERGGVPQFRFPDSRTFPQSASPPSRRVDVFAVGASTHLWHWRSDVPFIWSAQDGGGKSSGGRRKRHFVGSRACAWLSANLMAAAEPILLWSGRHPAGARFQLHFSTATDPGASQTTPHPNSLTIGRTSPGCASLPVSSMGRGEPILPWFGSRPAGARFRLHFPTETDLGALLTVPHPNSSIAGRTSRACGATLFLPTHIAFDRDRLVSDSRLYQNCRPPGSTAVSAKSNVNPAGESESVTSNYSNRQ